MAKYVLKDQPLKIEILAHVLGRICYHRRTVPAGTTAVQALSLAIQWSLESGRDHIVRLPGQTFAVFADGRVNLMVSHGGQLRGRGPAFRFEPAD